MYNDFLYKKRFYNSYKKNKKIDNVSGKKKKKLKKYN